MESISEVLQKLIDKSGLTPKDLAEGSGVNKNTIYTILRRDTTNVNIQTLKLLADYFQEDISIFCGLDEYKPPLRLSDDEEHLLRAYRSHSKDIQAYVVRLVEEPPKALETQEQRLLNEYRKLNQDGKEKINDHLADVLAGGRYAAHTK